MDDETTTITLGDKEFKVRRLTLKQLKKVFPILHDLGALKLQETESVDKLIGAIVIALQRDFPEMTADAIDELEISFPQLTEALMRVAKLAGLKFAPKEAPKQGEETAAAA